MMTFKAEEVTPPAAQVVPVAPSDEAAVLSTKGEDPDGGATGINLGTT